jgi:N-glycosylase/DNA lyase
MRIYWEKGWVIADNNMNEKDFHFTLPTNVGMRIVKLARVSLISCANQLIWNLIHSQVPIPSLSMRILLYYA